MARWHNHSVIWLFAVARLAFCVINEFPLDQDTEKINVITNVASMSQDLIIAGYFGAHFSNHSTSNYCGKINKQSLILVEAMRYAITRLNARDVLFGKNFGYRIIDTCRNTATLRRSFFGNNFYFMGSVGPPTSGEAAVLATVTSAKRSAVISPTASSSMFEDRFTYYNFFRTIPSDIIQIHALVDICLRFNWTYVSIVNSYGFYGQELVGAFIGAAEERGICFAKRSQLPREVSDADYAKVATALESERNANVVLLFTSSADTKRLLQAARHIQRFTWVSTEAWTVTTEFTSDVNKTAKGALILQYSDLEDKNFERYFLNLTLKENNYTWFREFWSDEFDCNAGLLNDLRPPCTGDEKLERKNLDLKYLPVNPVIAAVETIVCALRNTILNLCPSCPSCPNFLWGRSCIDYYFSYTYKLETGVALNLKIGNSTCANLSSSVRFNEEGYLSRNVKIINFDGVSYKEVGIWSRNESSGSLNISPGNITWSGDTMPKSVCSSPCKLGEIRQADSSRPKCCFTCTKCPANSIVQDNKCKLCGVHELADLKAMKCRPMPVRYIEYSHGLSLVTIAILSFGIVLNTLVFAIFIKKRNLRVIKASSRELSFIILMALYLCFICPLTFLAEPSRMTCGAQRFIVGLSLTGCYTPLMLKTNRIYRIFKAAKVMAVKPALVSPKSQILICIALLGVQLLLGIMWVVAETPDIAKIPFNNNTEVAEICKSDPFNFILNLLPCFVVMAVCTVYAYKTRKFPSNFNEAQIIVITMYMSCFLWGIFIPLILFLENSKTSKPFHATFAVANFPTIVGLVTLIGLFGPKLKQLYCVKAPVQPRTEMLSEFQRDTVVAKEAALHNDQALYTISEVKTAPETDSPGSTVCRPEMKDVGTNT